MAERLNSVTQCLLFVVRPKNADEVSGSGNADEAERAECYLLLSKKVVESHPTLCTLFKDCGVDILDSSTLSLTSTNDQIEIVELILHRGLVSPLVVHAEESNQNLVKKLLGEDKKVSVYRMVRNRLVLHAVDETNSEILESLLAANVGISFRSSKGGTLLNLAVFRNDVLLLNILLKHGFDPDSPQNDGSTSLLLATQNNKAELVKLLSDKGANVNAKNRDGISPLIVAAEEGYIDVVKQLLEAGADVNIQNSSGQTPLQLAGSKGFVEIVEYLLRYNPDPCSAGSRAALRYAVLSDGGESVKMVEMLVQHVILDAEDRNNLELFPEAIKKNYVEVVAQLVKLGTDINAQWEDAYNNCNSPLALALKYSRLDIIKLFLDSGIIVSSPDAYPCCKKLSDTVENLNLKALEALQMHAAEPCKGILISAVIKGDNPSCCNSDPTTANSQAALRKVKVILLNGGESDKMVEILVQHGFTLDVEDKNYLEFFQEAVEKDDLKVVHQLIKLGADVNAKWTDTYSSYGSPLALAVQHDRSDIIKLFIENGLIVNSCDDYPCCKQLLDAVAHSRVKALETLLAYEAVPPKGILIPAIEKGDIEVLEILLKHGLDPNVGDPSDKSNVLPLVAAAAENDIETIDLLIKYGANINGMDSFQRTALVIACGNGCLPIIEYLIRNGASLVPIESDRASVLNRAAGSGNFEVVDLLLKSGARCVPFNELSALHVAAVRRREDIFQFLLDHEFLNEELLSDTGICELFQRFIHNKESKARPYCEDLYLKNQRSFYRFSVRLARHMIKMKAAGLYYDESNRMPFWFCKETSEEEFLASCEAEIEFMKVKKIPCTKVSFYDILIGGIPRLVSYARNENILRMLNKGNFVTTFPIYASIISCQLRKGIFQKELLWKGAETFRSLCSKSVDLPQDLVVKVFSYLRNQDIIVFLNTVAPMKVHHDL